jgi:hypothetical protein
MVGTLGGFALNASAEEIADAPAAAETSAESGAPTTSAGEEVFTPPPLLPWGEKPKRLKTGPAGATSKQLAAMGADGAPARHTRWKRADSPKGFVSPRRTLRSTRSAVPPQPPVVGKAAPPPTPVRNVKFHYSAASQKVASDGAYASIVIAAPDSEDDENKVKLGLGDNHTLAEIAVQSADERHAVEVGWTIDRSVNGNDQPHLFVYYWVDNVKTCYNVCGFQPPPEGMPAPSVSPGSPLPANKIKKFGIQFSGNAWWIAYESEWIGFFPASLWSGKFNRAGMHQWFGEVASTSLSPCSSMGTGEYASEAGTAARFSNMYLIDGKTSVPASITMDVTSNYIDKDGTDKKREGGPAYTGFRQSDRTLRYGGPAYLEIPDENGTMQPNPACKAPQ